MDRRIVRTSLALSALLPLAACTSVVAAPPAAATPASSTQPAADGQQYQLRPGEQVSIADAGQLRYLRLVNDSRCAPDVQCVWAGDAEVAFEWTPAQGARRAFSLHTGVEPRQQSLGERRLVLVSLGRGPAPEATVRLENAAP